MLKKNKPYTGMFITIEGGEGVGKSTLAEKLSSYLKTMGYEVRRTREPGGTLLSEKIREFLLDPKGTIPVGRHAELLLFLAARAQHIEEVISPALREGKVVLCERFEDSTIAYQGCARNLGMQYVEDLCKLASEHLTPDATLLLDMDPYDGMKRVSDLRREPLDRVENEKIEFHKEVRQGFLHLADKHPERIIVLDALQSIEKVLEEATNKLKPFFTLKPALP